MLTIVFKDNSNRTYDKDLFTDYDCIGSFFVVMRDDQWVGMYALDQIKYIEYYSE